MKISKNKMIVSIVSISILIFSVVVMLLDILIPLNFWTHPALNFFFCLFLGYSVLSFYFGFKNNAPWFVLLGAVLLGFALFYVVMQYLFWWVGLIVALVLWGIVAILGCVRFFNKTEQVLNDNSDYKTYEQRKAEKEELEKNIEKEELPKIKSFK